MSAAIIKQIDRAAYLCRRLAARHRQGPTGRSQRARRRYRAEILALCSVSTSETEMVSWLVRHHLLMSSTAFKRDLADPKTIEDFVSAVQSPERLRLLLILTVVDIRAVGPNVWNEWKRTLLRTLFEAAPRNGCALADVQHGRSTIVEARQRELQAVARLETERGPRPCQTPSRQLLAGGTAGLAARQRSLVVALASAYR